MKRTYRKLISILLLVTLGFFSLPGENIHAESFDVEAESAILVDAESGKILFAKNADIPLPPASMTKIMTEYLVWEAIENGDITWETTTQISDYAYSISANDTFSGVGLYQEKDYTVRTLYEAMAINSDNATTIALAELIADTEPEFVKLMNDKAEEIGLTDAVFINSSGLDNKDLGEYKPKDFDDNATNLLSAKSTALLAYHFVNEYPDALEISSQPELTFDGKEIHNWNHMLDHSASYLKQFHYEGVDGLKTGYTDTAGYCFTGTAQRDDKRLITVVMKTDSEEARFKETGRLLDHGFKSFEKEELFKAGDKPKGQKVVEVEKGKQKEVEVGLSDPITFPIKSGEADNYEIEFTIDEKQLNKDGKLVAPIKKGKKIGSAQIVNKDGEDPGYITDLEGKTSLEVVTIDAVDKDNWFMLSLKAIGSFFANLFSTIFETVKGWFFVVN